MKIEELVAELAMWKARALSAEAKVSALRSPGWPRVRSLHLKLEPLCQACGGIERLEVHHVIPFHIDKKLELADSNLITLCESVEACHFRIGHFCDWHKFNPNVRADAVKQRKDRA